MRRVCWHTLLCTSQMIPLATSMKRLERWRRKWRNQTWAEHINNLCLQPCLQTSPSIHNHSSKVHPTLSSPSAMRVCLGDYSPAFPLNEAVLGQALWSNKKIKKWITMYVIHDCIPLLVVFLSPLAWCQLNHVPYLLECRQEEEWVTFISITSFVSATPNP